jgi:hypothetical protein
MDDLHRWFHKTLAGLSRKSDTAAAIRYALSRWRALGRYLDDGAIEIDNSAAERALRVVALGRKNYLFAGSDAGGERAAAIYSLLGSAKLNDLDPELYIAMSWSASLITLSTVSKNSCPGTWPLSFQLISQLLKCPPKNRWTLELTIKPLRLSRRP